MICWSRHSERGRDLAPHGAVSNGTQPKGFAGLASLASKLEEEAGREPAEKIQSDEPHAVGETERGQATAPAASGRREHDGESPQTGFSALSSLSTEEPAKQPATTQEGPETGEDDAELDGSKIEPAETPDSSGIAPPAQPPSPQRESIESRPTRPPPTTRSRRKWLWLVLIGAVAFYLFHETQKDDRIATERVRGTPKIASEPAVQARTPQRKEDLSELRFSKPRVGRDNVINVAELRWCLREDIRIDTLRQQPKTNAQIDEFNRLVSNYNLRCGSFRYTEGTLARARREVEQHRSEIVARVSPPWDRSGPLTDGGAVAHSSKPAIDGRSKTALTKEEALEALRRADPEYYGDWSDEEIERAFAEHFGQDWLNKLAEILGSGEKPGNVGTKQTREAEEPATTPKERPTDGTPTASSPRPTDQAADEAEQTAARLSKDLESPQGATNAQSHPLAQASPDTDTAQSRPVGATAFAREAPSDRRTSEKPQRPQSDGTVQTKPITTPLQTDAEPSDRPREGGRSASDRASEEVEQTDPDETARPVEIRDGAAQPETPTVGKTSEEARETESAHRGTGPENTGETEATKTQESDEDPPSSRRQLIHEIQMYLTAQGYEPGPIDGLYGRRTQGAIEAFERDMGMTLTGEATIGLWRKVRREAKTGTEQEPREEVTEETEKAGQTSPGG